MVRTLECAKKRDSKAQAKAISFLHAGWVPAQSMLFAHSFNLPFFFVCLRSIVLVKMFLMWLITERGLMYDRNDITILMVDHGQHGYQHCCYPCSVRGASKLNNWD